MKFKYVRIWLVVILIFIGSLYLYFKFNRIQKKIFLQPDTTIASQTVNKTIDDFFKSNTVFNILLLGYGGGNHDGAYLTDSMMIVHIDPLVKRINLISIPRDIWVKIPTNFDKGSFWKINTAYSLGLNDNDYPNKQDRFKGPAGGGNLASFVVGEVSGLTIDRFVALDFDGFKKTIDTLGGVDITVETTFDDYEYPIEGKEDDLCGHSQSELPDLEKIATQSATQAFPCRYQHIHFDKGLTHMDGQTALEYVRSRHSLADGTDFGRSKRQRNLLVAFKQKLFDIGFIPKALPFLDTLQDDVKTNLSLAEVKTLLERSFALNKYQISNIALTDQNILKDAITDDGQDILTVRDQSANWNTVHEFIQSSLEPNKQITSPLIKVENGTAIKGLATLAYNRLADRDYNLLPPDNSSSDVEKTTISVFKEGIDAHVIDDLKKEFGTAQVNFQQSDDQPYDILIVLGMDYNLKQGKKLIN